MKKTINFLFACIIFLQTGLVNAQFVFTKNRNIITLSGGDVSKPYSQIILQFDSTFRGSRVGIYKADTNYSIDFNEKYFGKENHDIQANDKGVYIITIQNNHKVQECENCNDEVPNEFKIKLDGHFYGPFQLNSKDGDNGITDYSSQNNNKYHPGYLFYDALYINSKWEKQTDFDSIRLILKYYKIDNDSDLVNNQFLEHVLKGIFKGVQGKGGASLSPASLISSVGGLDVTTIADGFAKFIVKRTKQELSIAFFDKFETSIKDTTFKDIQTIFPQTYITLLTIGDEIYNYEVYIQTLRESFEKDLASLPSNLPGIIENHEDYFNNMPDLKASLLSAFYITQSIQDQQHPGNIIEGYPIEFLDSVTNRNIQPSFQTLVLLSTSLKNNKNGDNYWASNKDIKMLFSGGDNMLLKIYLGLLEQKAKTENIKFIDKDKDVSLWKIIDDSYSDINNNIPKYTSYFKNLTSKMQSLEKKITDLKKVEKDSLLFENYYSFISSSIDLMKYFTDVEELPGFPQGLHIKDSTKKYFDMTQITSNILIDVNRRNYSSAIVNSVNLYELSIKEYEYSRKNKLNKLQKVKSDAEIIYNKNKLYLDYYDTIKLVRNKLKNLKNIDVSLLTVETKKYIKAEKIKLEIDDDVLNMIAPYVLNEDSSIYNKILTNNFIISQKNLEIAEDELRKFENKHIQDTLSSKVSQAILKYGSFMATIAQAKSSDDIKEAVEAAALPTGSARIKRETRFNVSLNAYCGLFAGQDRLNIRTSAPQYSYGVTAPIGLAISWGRKHSSFSIFVSVFDIGAITAFRFTNDTLITLPKIQLKDIISPGLFFSYGIPKTPLSINFGFQLSPALARVGSTENSINASMFRTTLGLCVDLPILNLYTKPGK
jgi:hypothetical protein